MPLQPYLVQNFALIFQTEILFEELVQNFELKRVGGAPKGHLFAPLVLALREGLALAKDLSLNRVRMASDCSNAVETNRVPERRTRLSVSS